MTRRRALVVDDSRAMRSLLERILLELDYAVSEASNGREALQRLSEIGEIDLALVDWNMPEMNGIDFVQALRSQEAYDDVRLMMVTTESDYSQVDWALQEGANGYATKPFTQETILGELARLGIGRKKMQITEEDIYRIAARVWDTVLHQPLQHSSELTMNADAKSFLTGYVHITGVWRGAVALHYPMALARQAASSLFNVAPEAVTMESMWDGTRELTNMISGNLKTMLPAPSRLGLPGVIGGINKTLGVPGGQVIRQAIMTCGENHLQVSLVQGHELRAPEAQTPRTKQILTVDDSAAIRRLVAFTLREAGYDIGEASSGTEALQQAKSTSFDLVLADVNMPDMDGITLIRHLRALPGYGSIPMLMLTTTMSLEKKQEGKAAGASGWIVKPFEQTQLVSLMKRILS